MPIEWFTCPDQQLTTVIDCMESCRMGSRCQTLPYLHLCAEQREWTGEPSTTQLLNGTMQTYLKITKPYAADPDSMAFMIHGTLSHRQLELSAKELRLVAEFSATFDNRNVADLLTIENGEKVLTDYKTWGSFRVAKALGIVEAGKRPDPSGAVYQKSGKWGKAGSPKMVPYFQQMEQHADNREVELQMNRYRVMLKDAINLDIDRMQVSAIVRDGGLLTSRNRGVMRNTYLIPVKFLPDDMVREYFDNKRLELLSCLEMDQPPASPCDDEECWEGRKCQGYCEVWNYCPKGVIERGIR